MSFDLKIQTVCDHKVYLEPVTLASDLRSLNVTKPLAASKVAIYASNDLVPASSYIIKVDPTTVSTKQRMIYLNKKWKSPEDYFEVTYYTISTYCPKCAGLNIINDIQYNVKGDYLLIRNENLLLQNLEKFTVTEIQSNPFHTFIGTALVKLLGSRVTDTAYITAKITQQIAGTLDSLKSLQEQYRLTGRLVTDGELLDIVENIVVRFDASDPTILRADITARAVSGKTVEYSQFLQLS